MTRLILGLVFYFIVSIIGVIARLFGKEFLELKNSSKDHSYWNYKDKEKSDPKILFIHSSSPLNQISSKKELKEKYPGVLKIIKIWLNNYKKESEVIDIEGKKNAIKLIKKSTIK